MKDHVLGGQNLAHTWGVVPPTSAVAADASEKVFLTLGVEFTHVPVSWNEHPAGDAKLLGILNVRVLTPKERIWHGALECLGRSAVLEIAGIGKGLLSKELRRVMCQEHSASTFGKSSVKALTDAILHG